MTPARKTPAAGVEVTEADVRMFLGNAFRNIDLPPLDAGDVRDIADGLASVVRHRIATERSAQDGGVDLAFRAAAGWAHDMFGVGIAETITSVRGYYQSLATLSPSPVQGSAGEVTATSILREIVRADDDAPDFGICDQRDDDGQWYRSATLAAWIVEARRVIAEPSPTPTPDAGEVLRAENARLREEVDQLKRRGAETVIAYHVAICSPKGVVPVDDLYDPQIAAGVEREMDIARAALEPRS